MAATQPKLGLRERKKRRTRETIVAVATGLFVEQGYEATTTAQIAEAAEVSSSTFFKYFPTKADVDTLCDFVDAHAFDHVGVFTYSHEDGTSAYALDNNVARLAEDHENARVLAEGLAELPGVAIEPSKVETNIVIFEVSDALDLAQRLADRGVDISPLDSHRLRAVTHLDVDRAGIESALDAFRGLLAA